MAKPKTHSVPAIDLPLAELLRERERCKMMLSIYRPKGPAGKGLTKRLHEVERRIALLERQADPN